MGLGLFFMGIQSTVRMREKYKFKALSAKHNSGGLGYNLDYDERPPPISLFRFRICPKVLSAINPTSSV
jgi:hypothetical protein